MSLLKRLARPEILELEGYVPGAYEPGLIRLNANESPWRSPNDKTERGLNVYPPPRPDALRACLAAHYAVPEDGLLVTRGSSESIDVLIRGFCRAGRDAIVVTPPTFDMYRVYAGIQGAQVIEAPLKRTTTFSLDVDALLAAVTEDVKLVFICTPNNPTGTSMGRRNVESLCEALSEKAIVVIDEAYHEFAKDKDYLDLVGRYENVVLLRTLSKFVSLAGVRCGSIIAASDVVEYLSKVLPPYTFPTPSIELVLAAFEDDALSIAKERVQLIRRERERMADALADLPIVDHVYPSDANFILLRVASAADFSELAHRAGILIRSYSHDARLANHVRITIGKPQDNDRLLRALSGGEPGHVET